MGNSDRQSEGRGGFAAQGGWTKLGDEETKKRPEGERKLEKN